MYATGAPETDAPETFEAGTEAPATEPETAEDQGQGESPDHHVTRTMSVVLAA